MIQKINKKILFRISVIVSSIMALFIGTSSRDNAQKLVKALDVPIFSIEKAYASDGAGDCCGSSDGSGVTFPTPSSSGVGISLTPPTPEDFSCGGCGGCFVAGTQVALANGTNKNIEDITIEDIVSTSSGDQSVMRKYHIPYTGLIYAFNGSEEYFVTPSHPFMTTSGWKSIDPAETAKETPDLIVEKLAVGDEILKRDGTVLILTSFESKTVETTVYNFDVNDSHDYYAGGLHVHNVSMKFIETAEARQIIDKP